MATYCARNRLTKVANDVQSAGEIDCDDDIHSSLVDVPLCRKVDQVGGVPDDALRKLKITPIPGLLSI